MTQTKYDSCNPFPLSDVDRHEIWEILVHRDVTAFVEADWLKVADDFDSESFVAYSGSSNPDRWTIAFPSLEAYRKEWERQAVEFQEMKLVGEDTKTFLFRASLLMDIDIHGNAAMAHKKINGGALTTEGREVFLNWQTVYWLRRVGGRWRVTGFLGYLPNPMPPIEPTLTWPSIIAPVEAVQHSTAGPYSPVLEVHSTKLVVISGQGPLDIRGHVMGDNIREQASFTLDNCRRQLAAASVSLSQVFKVTVYLRDIGDWAAFNDVYCRYFNAPYPVRTAIQAVLWGGIKVEIDMMAVAD